MAMTYSPDFSVPSALSSLTSLFGMGRGDPRCNNHHKFLSTVALAKVDNQL